MATIEFTATDIRAIATLHHATPVTKSDRGISPILTAVYIEVTATAEATEWRATATDRYIVAELSGTPALATESVTLQIASTDLVTLAKLAPKRGNVFMSIDGDRVEFSSGGRVLMTAIQVAGNFPPVAKLFTEDRAEQSGFGIDPAKLARLGKVLPPLLVNAGASERSSATLILEFTGEEARSPLSVTRPIAGYRALIQPVTIGV